METLRIFFLVITVTIYAFVYGQNYELLQKAFVESYKFEKNGEYNKAINELKNHYNENSYEINLRLGWLNYLAGNFTESTSYYQKAIQLKPMSEEAKMGYVLPLSAMGIWNAVINTYQDILQTNPYNTIVLYRIGSIYYGKEKYDLAYTYFEKLVNLYPFSYDGLLMFAWTNLKLGKKREANVLFNKVLLLSPGDTSALEGLNLCK